MVPVLAEGTEPFGSLRTQGTKLRACQVQLLSDLIDWPGSRQTFRERTADFPTSNAACLAPGGT